MYRTIELLDGSQLTCFVRFAYTKSTSHRFLSFFASRRSSLNKIGMTWSVIPPWVCWLATFTPYSATGWQIFKLLSQPFQQKQANMRTAVDLTSHSELDPCPIKLGREAKRRHFDVLRWSIKIRGFNQIKKVLPKLLHKIRLIILAKKMGVSRSPLPWC